MENKILDVLKKYNLEGYIQHIEQNNVGFVNKTFIITTSKNKYVLRESNPSTELKHIELEVEALLYLQKSGYVFTPKILENREGEFITKNEGNYFTLQNFIQGEIKASWNNLDGFTIPMLENFFAFSAGFTKAVSGFRPIETCENKSVFYYINDGRDLFLNQLNEIPDSEGQRLLFQLKDNILIFIEKTKKDMVEFGYDDLPKQLVHFDLHPGNVHFEGDKVVGLFDFDWARFDSRISDIAATISQSCYIFGGENSGLFIKEKIQIGLKSYREAYGQSEFDEVIENKLIRISLQGYVFFQLLWAMDWYKDNANTQDGLQILRHVINTCLNNDYEQLFD